MVDSKTWDYNGTTFRKCPKCGKGMPADWKEHKPCGWKSELAADPVPQKDVREFKPSSEYSDKGDEIARMSAVKTAADIIGENSGLEKLKEYTLIIHNWIKTGNFDIPIQEETIK